MRSSRIAMAALGVFLAMAGCGEGKAPAPAPAPARQGPRVEDMKIPLHQATRPVKRLQQAEVKRHEALNARVRKGGIDLVFLGDSIMQAWEGEGKAVWAKYYAKRKAVNFGINGDCTEHVLWRVLNGNVDGISPKLVVLLVGVNNARFNTSRQIADGVTAIVQALRRKLPRTKVLLLGIFPQGRKADNARRGITDEANRMFKAIADGRMIHYLELGDKFMEPDGSITPKMMSDGVHPTAWGHEIWAKAMEPKVAELMGER